MNITSASLLNIDLGPTKDALAMATLIPLVLYTLILNLIVYYITGKCIKTKSNSTQAKTAVETTKYKPILNSSNNNNTM
jgi:hypothetical protein